MAEDSKVIPMRPLRDVLREFEDMMDAEETAAPKDGPCTRCNGTGTEVIREHGYESARPCSH